MHQNIKDANYFNLCSIKNIYDLKKLTEDDAQRIIDKILEDLNLSTEAKQDYMTINGFKLKISNTFCKENGHDLEEKYKGKYPQLKQYNRENMLKNKILDFVICPQPSFIPEEIIDTFKKLK